MIGCGASHGCTSHEPQRFELGNLLAERRLDADIQRHVRARTAGAHPGQPHVGASCRSTPSARCRRRRPAGTAAPGSGRSRPVLLKSLPMPRRCPEGQRMCQRRATVFRGLADFAGAPGGGFRADYCAGVSANSNRTRAAETGEFFAVTGVNSPQPRRGRLSRAGTSRCGSGSDRGSGRAAPRAAVWFQPVRSSAWTTSERSSCSRSMPRCRQLDAVARGARAGAARAGSRRRSASSPSASSIARSTAFRSSRMLPGQP